MSKFSTLPDIDLTSVDVYETASSPELRPTKGSRSGGRTGSSGAGGRDSDVSSDEDEADGGGGSPSQRRRRKERKAEEEDGRGVIDKKGIRSDEARLRFQGSTEVKRGEPSLSQGRRKKSDAVCLDSDIYELEAAGNRASETPLARLRRLRLEAEELEQQLAAQAETEESKDGVATNGKTTQPSPEALLAQVRALRVGLGNLNGVSADGQDPRAASRVEDARALLQALENGSTGQSETGTAAQSDATAGVAPAAVTGSTALAEVEERLAALESIVGSNQGVLEETQSLPRPLLPTLARLEHISTLLSQPRHIDAISKRIKILVSELDRVYESRKKLAALPGNLSSTIATLNDGKSSSKGGEDAATPLDPITLSKLDDLFALSSRVQPLLPLTPSLLARLRSLSSLHSSASQFSSSLDSLKSSQAEMKSGQEEVKKALSSLEESMAGNAERVKGNLDVVMKRMEDLDKRVQAL